jgi:hypothetical protein
MTKPEIDPERIAALLDGRLSGHEREVLLSELASSPEQLALLADASMIAEELRLSSSPPDSGSAADNRDAIRRLVATEAAAPHLSLVTARQRRWKPAWSAAVAAALLIVIAPWVLRRSGFRGESAVPGGSAIARVEPSIPVGWDGTPWSVTRGASAALTPRARAVRVGARLADLELTVAAGDSVSRGIVDDIIALVEGVPLSGSVTQVYEVLRDSIGVAPSQLTPLVERGYDGVSALLGRSDVALGRWLETARIAAVRRNNAFFTSAQTTQMLRDLKATAVGQQAQDALSRVAAMLPVSTATDWSSLEAATTELLRASAR